eukprot:2030288-Amphidinium_carterae.1
MFMSWAESFHCQHSPIQVWTRTKVQNHMFTVNINNTTVIEQRGTIPWACKLSKARLVVLVHTRCLSTMPQWDKKGGKNQF